MILVLIPIGAIVVGLILFALSQGMGWFDVLGAGAPSGSGRRGGAPAAYRSAPTTFRERLDRIPTWALITIIAISALWLLAWFILLIVGLSFLS